eukprot:5143850-Pyramimonas_sp.AAC.1
MGTPGGANRAGSDLIEINRCSFEAICESKAKCFFFEQDCASAPDGDRVWIAIPCADVRCVGGGSAGLGGGDSC